MLSNAGNFTMLNNINYIYFSIEEKKRKWKENV